MKQIISVLDNLDINLDKSENTKSTKKKANFLAKDKFIIQHNDLIEARYKLNLQEKRIVLWLLTQIRLDDEDFKLHKLKVTEFSKMLNLKVAAQYSELQEVTLSLMKRVFKIYEPHTKSVFQVAWLSFARYHLTKGYVELRFDPALKPYLLQLKSHFTKLTLGDIMQLNSIYAIRIYELLKQYESIEKRRIDIKELREYCGIADKEYKKYNDFKKNVLEKAKKEINEKTDLKIDFFEIKESRKIVAIQWKIAKKNLVKEEQLQKIAEIQKELRSQDVIIEALLEYGFRKPMANRILKNHGEEVVKNALRAVDLQIQRKHAKNPKAMLQKAIQEKWHPEVFKTNLLKK